MTRSPKLTSFVDGRRPAYLCSLPVMIIGSIGVGRARNVQQLLVFRFIQAMGASPGTSVGFGVIGDIYRLEERGRAMGSYYGVSPNTCTMIISLNMSFSKGNTTRAGFSSNDRWWVLVTYDRWGFIKRSIYRICCLPFLMANSSFFFGRICIYNILVYSVLFS